ncbi:MAG TPA: hypothetical protein VF780_06785, partial [Nitrosospira sp.]
LVNFILSYHKTISRYNELRDRENRWRILFTGISLILLMAIPLIIFHIGEASAGTGNITAQVTALLTGLMAVHKSLSSWLDKRKVIGNFWKAESDLKTKLYAFEDKWKDKATQDAAGNPGAAHTLKDDFLSEARTAIVEARAIVQDEQSKFFDTLIYPSIDLGEMLKDTGDRAKALVSANISPELEQRNKQRQAKEALEAKIAEQRSKIAGLEMEIAQRKQLIEEKHAAIPGAPADDAEALKSEIASHRAKIRQAEDDLVIAKGQLEVSLRNRPA